MALDGSREVVEGHLVWGPVVLWRILDVCHILRRSHWWLVCLFLADGNELIIFVSKESHFDC